MEKNPLFMPFLTVTMVALLGTLMALYGMFDQFGSAIIGMCCMAPLIALDILLGE